MRMMGQMQRNMHRSMREALRLVQAGALRAATRTLERNLRSHWSTAYGTNGPDAAHGTTDAIDGEFRVEPEMRDDGDWHDKPGHAENDAQRPSTPAGNETSSAAQADSEIRERPVNDLPPGEFRDAHFTCAAGDLPYKLFIPAGLGAAPPLLIMLHGCSQTAGDFARGTRMNLLAQRHGYVVAYPAQVKSRNSGQCWNWFRREDQQRGRGEPAVIAALSRHLVQSHELDERRVFAAGLSAGGAMAVVLARAYPDVFAAIGVHSGLPFGIAHDVPSAFAAMKPRAGAASTVRHGDDVQPVPAIVFHGDRDATVALRNGTDVVAQCLEASTHRSDAPVAAHATSVERGTVPGGREFTRTLFRNDDGSVAVEQWIVHGAGHAWFGGDAKGSYTDPLGPDASEEMLRFFAASTHAATR